MNKRNKSIMKRKIKKLNNKLQIGQKISNLIIKRSMKPKPKLNNKFRSKRPIKLRPPRRRPRK